MTTCFWNESAFNVTDDCVPSVAMLNLKTANLVDYAWANPPSPDPSIPDAAYDLGKVALRLPPPDDPSGIATAYALPADTPLTFRVPLRSLGGSFSIGADSYARPPPMTNQYLFLYATTILDAVYDPSTREWAPSGAFGWLYQGGSQTYPTTGYLNSGFEILDNSGAVLQSTTWCHMHAKTLAQGGGSYIYTDAPDGAFPTGQGPPPVGSYTAYGYLRMIAPITLPAADFDGGQLAVSITPSSTSSSSAAGAPLAVSFAAAAPVVIIKLVASSTPTPSSDADWDF